MVVSGVTANDPLIVAADDGALLALWHYPATVPLSRRPTVPLLFVHGTFGARSFFGSRAGLAPWLAGMGYDCWVAELRGRQPGATGDWNFEDWIVRDAPALLRAMLGATGARQVIWIGHSAGGVIGAGFAARSGEQARMLAGLILLATPSPDAPGLVHLATSALGHLVGHLVGRFPARALRIGPADESRGVLRQWLGWNLSRWTGHGIFDYRAALRDVTVPVLAVAGSADLLSGPKTSRRLLEAFGSADRTMVVCGRAQGYSRSYTHNRLVIAPSARQEVWPVIAGWLEERFG